MSITILRAEDLEHVNIENGCDPGTWSVEDGELVARRFSGSYTIPEIRAVLEDMERVQAGLVGTKFIWGQS